MRLSSLQPIAFQRGLSQKTIRILPSLTRLAGWSRTEQELGSGISRSRAQVNQQIPGWVHRSRRR